MNKAKCLVSKKKKQAKCLAKCEVSGFARAHPLEIIWVSVTGDLSYVVQNIERKKKNSKKKNIVTQSW